MHIRISTLSGQSLSQPPPAAGSFAQTGRATRALLALALSVSGGIDHSPLLAPAMKILFPLSHSPIAPSALNFPSAPLRLTYHRFPAGEFAMEGAKKEGLSRPIGTTARSRRLADSRSLVETDFCGVTGARSARLMHRDAPCDATARCFAARVRSWPRLPVLRRRP